MSVFKRCVVFLLTTLAFSACAPKGERDALDHVRAAGVLRWGGDIQGGEPYVYEDPNRPGTLIGFEVDLAEAIAKELGVRAEFVQADWSNLVASLDRETFDVAMNGIEVTPARAARVDFTRPYFVFAARLVAREGDASVRDLASLRGRRVGTLANSFSWDLLRSSGAAAVPYEGVQEPYADLLEGRTDAVLLDDIIADRYGLVMPGIARVADVGEGYYAVAVRRGDPKLRAAVDAAIAKLARSGELRRILARWRLDSDRQSKLATWTEADTRAIAPRPTATASDPHASFSWRHAALFLQGAGVTLLISISSMAIAVAMGLGLSLLRLYGPRFLSVVSSAYVELFRGTPVLLQLYVLYYGVMGSLREAIGFHQGVEYDAMIAAILGLGLNYAAYEAEIYRAALFSVPPGQMEAAKALGMSTGLALRRIIVPQAGRIALPGVTNDFIALLKDSSLVSVITVVELTKRMTITAIDVRSWAVPGLLCAALYMAMSFPLSRLSRRLEAKLAREELAS